MPYRESIVSAAEMNPPKNKDLPRGTVMTDSSKLLNLRLRVVPLPQAATDFLIQSDALIKELYEEQSAEEIAAEQEHEENGEGQTEPTDKLSKGHPQTIQALQKLRDGLRQALAATKTNRDLWKAAVEKIVAFGPRRVGPNILIDSTATKICQASSIEGLLSTSSST